MYKISNFFLSVEYQTTSNIRLKKTSSNLGEGDGGHSSCEGGRVEHMQGGQADLIVVEIMLMMMMVMMTMEVIARGINDVKAY